MTGYTVLLMCQSQTQDIELYTDLSHNTSELYTESSLVTKLALNI